MIIAKYRMRYSRKLCSRFRAYSWPGFQIAKALHKRLACLIKLVFQFIFWLYLAVPEKLLGPSQKFFSPQYNLIIFDVN
jgi:hypothetical protein